MFSGLTSRCVTPSACAASSAAAIWLHDGHRSRRGQRAVARQQAAQRGAVDQAHLHVELAVDLAVVVDRARRAARSAAPRCRPRVASARETPGCRRIAREISFSATTRRLRVSSASIDLAHPAATQQPHQLIGPEPRPHPRNWYCRSPSTLPSTCITRIALTAVASFDLERARQRNGSVLVQPILARPNCGLHERLHRRAGRRVRILRADDLIGRLHDRVRTGLRRLVERRRVHHQVVALPLERGAGNASCRPSRW